MLLTPGPTGPHGGSYFRFPPSQEFHGLRMIAQPTSEPLSLDEAKLHARVDIDDDDVEISGQIIAARQQIENATYRLCRPQTWRLSLMQWPRSDFIQIPLGPALSVVSVEYTDSSGVTRTMAEGADYLVDMEPRLARIVLPYSQIWPPVVMQTASPIQITFRAGYAYASSTVTVSGTTVTRTAGDAFDSSLVGQIAVIGNDRALVGSVESSSALTLATAVSSGAGVSFTADALPAIMLQAIKLLMADWYENREDSMLGRGLVSAEIKNGIDRLTASEAVYRF